MFLKVYL
jgi:hypothetical protein